MESSSLAGERRLECRCMGGFNFKCRQNSLVHILLIFTALPRNLLLNWMVAVMRVSTRLSLSGAKRDFI